MTRDRSAKNAGDRQTGQEQCDRLRSFSLAEPVRQIQNDSGGVPSLPQPQQKTRHIQLMHRVNQAGQHSYSSPGNQNAGDPNASSELVKHEIAGYLEEEIAKKENSNQQSELLAANGQFLVHRQGGKSDVDPAEIGDDVEKKE
jgi:hypothetical protein